MADVSSNNGYIHIPDYSRAGHAIIGIKASQGQGYRNPYHYNQAKLAHDFGLTVLHYHYCDTSSQVGQIENFRQTYLPVWKNGDYIGFDIEEENLTTDWGNKILSKAHSLTGHEPVGYVPLSKLDGLVIPGKRLWVPDYDFNKPNVKGKGFKIWAWQYTDGNTGPYPHIASGVGSCDLSIVSFGPAFALNTRKILTKRRK